MEKSICLLSLSVILTACGPSLPSCKQKETKDLVEDIINRHSYAVVKFVSLDDIKELSYNKDKEIRLCEATVYTTQGGDEITYSITWQDKEEGMFYVEVN